MSPWPLALLLAAPFTGLQAKLEAIAASAGGRMGIAVTNAAGTVVVNGNRRFSLQSVTKLITAAATLDAVDRGREKLNRSVLVRKSDLSVNVQPIVRLVGPSGYRTTVGDLIRRAVIESDSAANDILYARLGGASAINAILRRKGVSGVRVDRDERHLQAQTSGLDWRPEYTDPKLYEVAKVRLSEAARDAAYEAYRKDLRDTATPHGMATFLWKLADGRLLGKSSTRFLRAALRECKTFPNRLKVGMAPGWTLEHKTGTSGTRNGLTVATNDVGIATHPQWGSVAIVVFVADSRLDEQARAAVIARVGRAITSPASR
jgi:beta-lactamase class A